MANLISGSSKLKLKLAFEKGFSKHDVKLEKYIPCCNHEFQ